MKLFLIALAIVTFGVVATVLWLVLKTPLQNRAREREARRRRYVLNESGDRLPMAPGEVVPAAPKVIPDDYTIPPVSVPYMPKPPGVSGRMVSTPDGDMILTNPPFALRDTVFSPRTGRFVNAVTRRLPPWIIVCPKVRLDAILTPTKPDGRDPRDWREWRKRVRMRSVDLVLCDRRNWRPLLAIVFDPRLVDARLVGGGQDKILDEVFAGIGLPFMRLTGDFEKDWPRIQSHVESMIIPHMSDESLLDAADRTTRVDADSAVTLLKMDGEKGWLLE